jgi:tetratricopeptide (TPR) repeat protein
MAYRKWVILGVAVFALAVVVFVASRSRNEAPVTSEAIRVAPPPRSAIEPGTEEKLLLEAIGKDPRDAEKLAQLGDLYFESNRYDQAIETYQKVLKLAPGDVDTYNDLGLALFYTGNTEAAVETLRKGTEVTPSYQRVWLSLGFVLSETGRYGEAKKALEKAMEIAPNSDMGREAERFLKRLG